MLRYWYLGPEITQWWNPVYKLKDRDVHIDDVRSAECPRSVEWRHPELLQIIQTTRQAEGVSDFGRALGSPAKWPARYYDAVAVVKQQERVRERAFDKAHIN